MDFFDVGRGDVHGVMLGVVRVADAGEHIRNGISDVHDVYPPIRVTGRARISGKVSQLGNCDLLLAGGGFIQITGQEAGWLYQLAFLTPGICPL